MSEKEYFIKFRPAVDNWSFASGSTEFYDVINNLFDVPCVLTEKEIPELRGVCACGFNGAQELIDAIHEFGSIDIKAED